MTSKQCLPKPLSVIVCHCNSCLMIDLREKSTCPTPWCIELVEMMSMSASKVSTIRNICSLSTQLTIVDVCAHILNRQSSTAFQQEFLLPCPSLFDTSGGDLQSLAIEVSSMMISAPAAMASSAPASLSTSTSIFNAKPPAAFAALTASVMLPLAQI